MHNPTTSPAAPSLPEAARPLLRRITSGESLGASRNIREINDLFVTICEAAGDQPASDTVRLLLETGEYLAATRGRNTPAIGNAIRIVLKNLAEEIPPSAAGLRDQMAQRRDRFNAVSLRNKERMGEYGANLLGNCQTLFAFDYSSSMLAVLDHLAQRGRSIRVIVPESRVLDGGRPIAQEATALGHRVEFIVDMVFAHFLRQSDAVLIGAETIFANGDCWNTVGSYPIAEMAAMFRIPYYVATEMIKIDPRSYLGIQKEMEPLDYAQILGHPATFDHPELVSVLAPELDNVPHSLISAYITPRGIMLPEHIWGEALRFLEGINASPLPES